MTAYSYELVAPRELVLREDVEPAPPLASDELVGEAEASIVSPGTEIAAWVGRPPLRPSRMYPRRLGYCHLARVTAAGADVDDIRPGDWIITHQCHRSHVRLRRSEVLLTLRDGAAERRRAIAAAYLYHLGYAALLAGAYAPGHAVAIVGAGALGLATTQLAVAFGATPLVFTSRATPDAHRLPPTARVRPKELPAADMWGYGLDGADVVVNTSDAWSDFRLAQQVARTGGTVVLLGFPGRGLPAPEFNPLDSALMYDRQLTIRHAGHVAGGSPPAIDVRFTLPRNMAYLADLIRHGALDPTPLIEYVVPWRDLAGAYRRLESRPDGVYTAVLDWQC
jgi:threonine dehydrogenase-like Zn-dependent dehydrogenase